MNARARVTRREMLRLAAAGGAAALTGLPLGPARAAAPELVIGMSLDPGHLDPRVEAGGPGWSIFSHMFDGFVFRDERTNPIPWLVAKWEQASPTVLRWHLRKGVKFHNGEDFTAESVKFSLEQYAAPTSRSPWKTRIGVIREYRIQDPHTIDLVTERPNRPGQHVVMQAHPGYWGKRPAFSQMRFRFIPENGTRLAALEAGEVMVVNNVPPDQISRLRANPNLRVIISPTNRVIFIALRTDRKPFNDKRVRQALNYAIDREALSKGIMGGLAPIAKAPLPESVFGAHPSLPPYQYDPERAKKLLVEAGAAGAPFFLGVPNGRYLLDKQVGEAIAGYLEAVGLQVKFESPLWSSFVNEVTKYERSKYDGFMFGWGVTTGEPDQLMGDHFHSTAVKRTLYANPEVDRLINEARENFDEARVRAAYLRAQEIVWDECPWIWLLEQPDINAVNKRLKWTAGRRDEYLLFHDVALGA